MKAEFALQVHNEQPRSVFVLRDFAIRINLNIENEFDNNECRADEEARTLCYPSVNDVTKSAN